MDDVNRIRYVTEHYAQLQGLRLLPLSAPFLLAAVERMAGVPFVPAGLWTPLALTALVAPYSIGRYYVRRFGHAPPLRWRSGMLTLLGSCAGFLWFEWLQETLAPPVSLPLLFVALALARLGLVARRLRVHYLWIAGAVTAFAMLPHGSVSADTRAAAANLLIGGGLAVAAVGDDRVLRRAFAARGDSRLQLTPEQPSTRFFASNLHARSTTIDYPLGTRTTEPGSIQQGGPWRRT